MLGRDLSSATFPESGYVGAWHGTSHHGDKPENVANYSKVNRYHVQNLAYFCDKLAKIPDGDGTVLDHVLIYKGSNMGNSHRHAPDAWMAAMRYLVEELHADVNARDNNGYTPLHHAAARGDDEMIRYLVSRGADVKAVSRNGRTVVDMANGPVQRLRPFPETIELLEKLGAKNQHHCVSC